MLVKVRDLLFTLLLVCFPPRAAGSQSAQGCFWLLVGFGSHPLSLVHHHLAASTPGYTQYVLHTDIINTRAHTHAHKHKSFKESMILLLNVAFLRSSDLVGHLSFPQ